MGAGGGISGASLPGLAPAPEQAARQSEEPRHDPGTPQDRRERARRLRQSLPVYDLSSGEDLETPVNLDNTLLPPFPYKKFQVCLKVPGMTFQSVAF